MYEYPDVNHLLNLITVSASASMDIQKRAKIALCTHNNVERRRDQLKRLYRKLFADKKAEIDRIALSLPRSVGTSTIDEKECANNPEATRMCQSFKVKNPPDPENKTPKSDLVLQNFDVERLINPILEAVTYRELERVIIEEANLLIQAGGSGGKLITDELPRDLQRLFLSRPGHTWTSKQLKKEFGDKFQRPNNLPWDNKFNKAVDKNIYRLAQKYPDRIILDASKRRIRSK